MSGLQALVGSGAECSGGNSISQFVKQLDRNHAVEQDVFRPEETHEQFHPRLARGRVEFDEKEFVDEFLNGGGREHVHDQRLFGVVPNLESELGRIGPTDWAADFESFQHIHGGGGDAGFEAAFNRALQHAPESGWANEFVQGAPLAENEVFERAFSQQHHAALEDAFSREFAAVHDTLIKGKGKAPALGNDEIAWEEEFAKRFNQDPDMDKLGKLFQQYDLGTDAVKDWESEYEDFQISNASDAWGQDEVTDPDPVTAPCAPYVFESNNPYLSHADPMAEGQRILDAGGSLSAAALAFEAAVQRDPDNSEGWALLGITQAENEKEGPAIAALQRSVQTDPTNLKALMALAVSYTNEGQEIEAYATLERWLKTQYPSIASMQPATSYTDKEILHTHVTNLFLEAARQGPSASQTPTTAEIDPDIQIGLGVLFYNSSDFTKAIDCFTSALSLRPNDYLLWNRLGATLANSGRSEEAIDAYYKALELKPRFVRGRYNLGVSCINVGCYKEAVEHLLGALSMHVVGDQGGGENVSGNLWETLRRAFILMDRRDLAEKAHTGQDVSLFKDEFEF
ncbi:uncharacterized protein SPPG_03570 [Spizellomyces punctatus DAOM BR117]|uniref:Uncharacterized protein n=1 Tax=Spizellomyces punctatus (strain DAOM BR117) TaxID=645134 RepID=A0A0L0HL47_SPIPD|nr:uncharacterized protein SPPG_03570 [Spizellomyces punctatus DAOM BR117]KND01778.1 hypothetical protein SPPG_03570 [Spizellomyces punctatus DAOM BR117]|eukprot:XP_016609817.1 hypothetical protein SPPG_03570 [Spizellomyces punctatus DAOM BR117]